MKKLLPHQQGFFRAAAVNCPVNLANPVENARAISSLAKELVQRGVGLAVFPELSISGYSVEDLMLQDRLHQAIEEAFELVLAETSSLRILLVLGAPLRLGDRLYNCAVYVAGGRIVGVTPKCYLPNYREFYEKRYYSSGYQLAKGIRWESELPGAVEAPIGPGIVRLPQFARVLGGKGANPPGVMPQVGAEICEDLWVPEQPATRLALAGANILVNLSGSPASVARSDYRRLLVAASSARQMGAYLYSSCGYGESTNDLAWDGQTLVYEMGQELAAGEEFSMQPQIAMADIDLAAIAAARQVNNSFTDCASAQKPPLDILRDPAGGTTGETIWQRDVYFTDEATFNWPENLVNQPVRFPFVPADRETLERDCRQAYRIQAEALQRRVQLLGEPRLVIGVSGGLDSTHALLVAVEALHRANLPKELILPVTMPGFATSDYTKSSAYQLCSALGLECQEIDIRAAAEQMLAGLDHPYAHGEPCYDVTFENVQAGLRTDYLFRLANRVNGLVIGTGDLSELAQGWCTYGVGDHMSHYAVNAGLPKTAISHLVRWAADCDRFGSPVSEVLRRILDTEISPELVPVTEGKQIQSTQDLIGPYELHDFFLYHFLRGSNPTRIAFLTQQAWQNRESGLWPTAEPHHEYDLATILRWEQSFLRRFFTSQYKRTCVPNGPKVMPGGSLSPRGDWRMPSDAQYQLWQAELSELLKEVQEKM